MHRVVGSLIFSIILSGCADGALDLSSVDLRVTVNKPVYSATNDVGATVVLRNYGTSTVYGPMNEYVYVERLFEGTWVDRSPWFSVDGIGPSFPIAPGDSLVEYMNLNYVGRQAGVYRFVFEVALDPNGRRPVPFERAASAPFAIEP